ncbi:MAG: hypothetical protein MUP85_19990, partial [Candidatus Lokiarchaeota archaeon]|nr:hypothetical protein [Candidatus Lokiarchaeota archaeon]
MMYNLFYLAVISFVFISNSFPQTNTFENLYGDYNKDETGFSIIEKSDGNFVIAGKESGYLILKSVNQNGDEIWKQVYDIGIFNEHSSQRQFELIQPDSESFIIAGIVQDSFFIVKTNITGNLLWSKKHLSPIYNTFYQFIEGNANDYLILSGFSSELFLIKIDEYGDTLWTKVYNSGGGAFTQSGGIIKFSLGGHILCGNYKIYRIDDSGEVSWSKDVSSRLVKVLETSDSSLLFTTRASVLKTDQSGTLIWEFPYSNLFGLSLTELNNNYYVYNSSDKYLIKIDNNGNYLWTKIFAGSGYQLKNTSDDNLILCGEYLHPHLPYGDDLDIWLLKINSDGEYKDVVTLSPRPGNDLLTNSNFKIQWLHKNIENLKIEYSTNNGTSWNLIDDNISAETGFYDWIVPASFSEFCKIKLSETSSSTTCVTPGNFRILPTSPYQFISINEVKMWIGNNGDGSHDPFTDGNGFYWPKENDDWTKSAIFQDGLVFGGKVNEEIRVNGNTHRAGLQPGIILPGGTPDTSTKPIYGVWKLKKGWENLPAGTEREYYEYIYNNWPADLGAPYIDINGDGEFTPGIDVPDYIGDMVLFYVANDMDSALSVFTYGMLPMGLEFQTSIFGFDR